MLDLSTAVLCDFAQVRDRLLFVSSGAVSRLYRQELPSPLGLMVGLIIEVPLEDAGMEHRLRAEVINRHGTVLATLENLFRVSDAGLFPHEVQQVPLVLSITGVRARTWGTHQVRLYLDEDLVRALTLYVVPAAGPQAVVRTAPTQSRVADDEGTVGGTGTEGVDGEAADAPTDAPLPWAAPPEGEPAPEPARADEGESHELVIDVDTGADDDIVTVLPDPDVPAPASEEAAPAFAWDEPEAERESQPEPEPQSSPSPWASTATIAAPRAEEPAPRPEPATQVYDFDEDDLDADPADRPQPEPNSETDTPSDAEKSRFAFRYRYDDDEDESPS